MICSLPCVTLESRAQAQMPTSTALTEVVELRSIGRSNARCFHLRRPTRGAVWYPGPIAAAGVGGFAPHPGLVEPQRLRAFAPGIATVDHQARTAATALRVDGGEHDVGAAAGLGQPPVIAHQGDAPQALAPAAKPGVATEAGGLLVGAHRPALGAFLATAPRPGLADEAVGTGRGNVHPAPL